MTLYTRRNLIMSCALAQYGIRSFGAVHQDAGRFNVAAGVNFAEVGPLPSLLEKMCWFSSTEVIYTDRQADGGALRFIERSLVVPNKSGLTRAIRVPGEGTNHAMDSPPGYISPNGTWAAWPSAGFMDPGLDISQLAGARHFTIHRDHIGHLEWSSGSDLVYCFTRSDAFTFDEVTAYSLRTGKPVVRSPLPRLCGLRGVSNGFGRVFMPCNGPINGGKAVGVAEYAGYMMRSRRYGRGLAVTLGTYDIGGDVKQVSSDQVSMPSQSDFIQAVVSHDHRRVVWQLGFASSTELWLSGLAGENMCRLAWIPYVPSPSITDYDPPISDLCWNAGSDAIGCRVRDTIYMVQV